MQEVHMPLLQVRDCPEDLYKKITLAAKRQNRTIAQQILALLQKSLGQTEPNLERRGRLLEKIDNRTLPAEVRKVDAVALIREDRDR